MQNFNISSLLIVLLVSMSCNVKQKPTTSLCKVQVALEPDFYNESRIDTLIFSKPYHSDTSRQVTQLVSLFGQQNVIIESGEITISALSIFESKYSKTIDINSDTVIIFQKNDFPILFEEAKIWDKDLILKKNDTVVVYYFNSSCSMSDESASVRKISCFKNDTSYLLKYTDLPRGTADVKSSYKTKKCSNSFIKNLNSFYQKIKEAKAKKQEIISTINAVMLVRVGNKIFQITDPTFTIGNFYDTLIRDINGS